jgi:hypothetical protein
MTATLLYRIGPAKRMQRYYRLDVQPDLFGQLDAFSTFKYCLMIPNGAVANVLRATGRARDLFEFSTKTPVDD